MPGWHTTAALQPRIDPRVVEREALEQAQRETLARAKVEAAIVVDLPGPDGLTKNRARRARPGHSALLLHGHPLEAD